MKLLEDSLIDPQTTNTTAPSGLIMSGPVSSASQVLPSSASEVPPLPPSSQLHPSKTGTTSQLHLPPTPPASQLHLQRPSTACRDPPPPPPPASKLDSPSQLHLQRASTACRDPPPPPPPPPASKLHSASQVPPIAESQIPPTQASKPSRSSIPKVKVFSAFFLK